MSIDQPAPITDEDRAYWLRWAEKYRNSHDSAVAISQFDARLSAAEKERDKLLEHIGERAVEADRYRSALRELVFLKRLKENIEKCGGDKAMQAVYESRKAAAWDAARAALDGETGKSR